MHIPRRKYNKVEIAMELKKSWCGFTYNLYYQKRNCWYSMSLLCLFPGPFLAFNHELILKDKTNDLNIKRNLVTQREKEIEEQSQTVISVQNLIEVLQEKESGNTVTLLAKAYARIRELETQVEGLKESIRKQKQEQIYLKLQADKAEKKAKDQASKNEKIEYFVSEQWVSIQQTEQALRIAEAIMLKAQAEVADKADGLSKASALYLFPLFGMFTLFSFIFGMSKTFAKSAGSSSTLKTRRKSDRRHAKKWS
ncbi:uncharacterized protein LOC131033927 isoform X2 [Cryptomeria japonica]|uniref:uncharacterized protein LOC131033927 isoform X2 n=1 Tax=Cryptomeria japonica TaxID=3369 RepID=UPI0025AB941D|nr:uncharacterized protein LOC131033927 isoform X2 [Cryptomeria japonica]XP_057821221.1 uncharacterized protein LOC131033927 isoform X2 [Cryptomeria japonica]XP_057821222.1 uncharacterized protein LOC131033927 isoform X2 [Cryptomeria japonica]XP_057821223.1 uncharacterized protein LOC131033927 isoform X2 [Cryptomeria japonica]